MSHPHTTQIDRDAIEDRGLVDDDRTENVEGLRSANRRPSEPTRHQEVRGKSPCRP